MSYIVVSSGGVIERFTAANDQAAWAYFRREYGWESDYQLARIIST